MSEGEQDTGVRSMAIRTLAASLRQRSRVLQQNAADRFGRFVDRRILLTIGSVLLVLGIGQVSGPLHPRTEFYTVVAQILPVFMLVAAVEGRYFRERAEAPSLDRFMVRGLWFSSLIGVGAALLVVARGHDSEILRGLVLFALVMVGILVTVFAVHGPARSDPGA